MKAGWQIKQFSEIAKIRGGKRVPKGYKLQTSPTDHPYITVSDFDDRGTIDTSKLRYISDEIFTQISAYTISSKDLYLSIAGTIGKTGFVPPELDGANLTENACRLILHPCISKEFIYYFTQSYDFACQARVNTRVAAQPKLALERLKTITLAVPAFSEQQRIVSILDKAFDGIATAKTNAEKNLQNARALFDSHLQAIFTRRGSGWGEGKIADLAKHSLGKMLDKSKNKGVPKSYLRNVNVRWFSFDLSDLLEMRFLPEEAAKYTAIKGDVLICEGGYPGRAAIWNEDYPIYFQKALHRVRFHNPVHSKWFVYFLYSQDRRRELRQYFSGMGIQHFTGEVLSRFKIPLAPTPELRRLTTQFDQLAVETQHLESIYQQKLTTLDALKKSLLHQAFTGAL